MRHPPSEDPKASFMTFAQCREHGHQSLTRVTKEGRTLTYFLNVMQQPERARACGSGAKSSADRRPVDPPPVVEMRIFEGDGPVPTDVTFTYNANFFLFTTLEIARPMAHGRMPPPAPQVPVLTGMPVSGMAYLDRPKFAGYFIFPDLSVRHEGRYRLSFNLYEETKEPRDADAAPAPDHAKPPIPGAAPDASFDWRIEIKSAEFTVYSAKKFPGLTESTSLSKLVAEQGCRVRIRRDVRMRRRDGKAPGDYDAADDEYARAGRAPSIHEIRERSRSLSSESAERQPYAGLERRLSGEGARPYAYPAPRPQSYLTFGAAAGTPYPAPPPRFAPPPPSYPPAPAAYPAVPYRQPAPPPPRDPHENPPPPPESPSPSRPWPNAAEGSSAADRPARGVWLPPIHLPPIEHLAPMAHFSSKLAKWQSKQPLTSIFTRDRAEHNPTFAGRVLPPLPAPPANPHVGKRTHQAAFDPQAKQQDQPLYNGMRPDDARDAPATSDDDSDDTEDDDLEPAYLKNMTYKRANGTMHCVLHPPS